MEQYPNGTKEKIRRFKEVELRETEFKKASELDDGEFENIRSEYFRRTFVYPLIVFFIAAALFVLWLVSRKQNWYVSSDVIKYALLCPVVLIGAMGLYQIPRCINSLVIISKIKKQDFYWHAGRITRRARLWLVLGWEFYYIVDDEYCSRLIFDPRYRKGTEVYFLHFPDFMRSSYMGGIVVRKRT